MQTINNCVKKANDLSEALHIFSIVSVNTFTKFAALSRFSMSDLKPIKTALISVFYKDGLEAIARELSERGVTIFSTGGTQVFLESLGIAVEAVEDLTSYPSILGGRVKTLHPKVFGGILGRRDLPGDLEQLEQYAIPEIDLVMVDLYPFEETLASGASASEIIEKIDIGGISLIRAAAKNFNDVMIVSSRQQYPWLHALLMAQNGHSTLEQRKQAASQAFATTSAYDTAIGAWFAGNSKQEFPLRYGENPHQQARFVGDLSEAFEQLHGKALSYNNLLDIDAAVRLIRDFPAPGCAILKHNNACGAAMDDNQQQAWEKALAGDPVSAFGGILIFNRPLEEATARLVDSLFSEVVMAPDFEGEALQILQSKKNRILLRTKAFERPQREWRTVLNGILEQEPDSRIEGPSDFQTVTKLQPEEAQHTDMVFAAILVKHTKSNAIVLVRDRQLLASGTGQTSRVDALRQAIHKAGTMGFETRNCIMASDAFFPFADCIEIAAEAGVSVIVQPGGSIRDAANIEVADQLQLRMVTTGIRHFKH